jgi:hypothetical protein
MTVFVIDSYAETYYCGLIAPKSDFEEDLSAVEMRTAG